MEVEVQFPHMAFFDIPEGDKYLVTAWGSGGGGMSGSPGDCFVHHPGGETRVSCYWVRVEV